MNALLVKQHIVVLLTTNFLLTAVLKTTAKFLSKLVHILRSGLPNNHIRTN